MFGPFFQEVIQLRAERKKAFRSNCSAVQEDYIQRQSRENRKDSLFKYLCIYMYLHSLKVRFPPEGSFFFFFFLIQIFSLFQPQKGLCWKQDTKQCFQLNSFRALWTEPAITAAAEALHIYLSDYCYFRSRKECGGFRKRGDGGSEGGRWTGESEMQSLGMQKQHGSFLKIIQS